MASYCPGYNDFIGLNEQLIHTVHRMWQLIDYTHGRRENSRGPGKIFPGGSVTSYF